MKKVLHSPLALLAAVVLLRLPGFAFGVLNIDESDFLVFGAGIWKGLIPYRDFVEIKPPLGYFTYALAGGLSIWPIRALGVAWIFATALILRSAARRWTGSEEAGWAAAWMSLFASLVEVPAFGSEVMMNLPIAAAIWFFVRARGRRDFLLCGVCAGIATLYRHQAAIAPLALALGLLFTARTRWWGAFGRAWLMFVGTLAPWAIAAGWYASLGQLPAFLDWTIWRNISYATSGDTGSALQRGAVSTVVCVAAAFLPWALAARESLRPRADRVWAGLALMLWLTWLPVAAGGRFYEHYFLQFVPPLAMLAAPGAAALLTRWRELAVRTRALVAVTAVVPVVIFVAYTWARGMTGGYPAQEPHTRALAQWLRENTESSETLFVWGHYTPIYTLSHRLPGTRYLNTSVHMGNFDPSHLTDGFDPALHCSSRDVEATLRDLDERRPAWFVDTSPAGIHHWDRIPLSAFPALAQYRDQNYVEVAHPGGATVYRRREVPATQASRVQ